MWRITVQQKSVKVHFYVHLMSIFMSHKISFPIFSTMRPIWNFSAKRIISNLAIFTGRSWKGSVVMSAETWFWVECDFSMTIEVFKFLNEKMSKLGEDREIARPNNTGSIGGNKTKSRKRSAEDFILSDHPGNKVHIPNSANQEWFTLRRAVGFDMIVPTEPSVDHWL